MKFIKKYILIVILLASCSSPKQNNANQVATNTTKKIVDVNRFYDTDRYRPKYENFEMKPLFIMTSEL